MVVESKDVRPSLISGGMNETLTRNGEKRLANMSWSHAGERAGCVFLIDSLLRVRFPPPAASVLSRFRNRLGSLGWGFENPFPRMTEIYTRVSTSFSFSMEPYPLALLNLGLACHGIVCSLFCVGAGFLAARTLSLCALRGLQEKTANAVFEFPVDAAG